jgi:DNA-binding HxlR family transcriptional regulator
MGARIEDCPLAAFVQHIGDWRTLELLHDAFDGYTHIAEFSDNLKMPADLLRKRLDTLVANHLMNRRTCGNGPRCEEYVLTELGRSLRPIILVMAGWLNQHLKPEERAMILVDARTGEEVEPVVVDRVTSRRIDSDEYVFSAGPAASDAMRARYKKDVSIRKSRGGAVRVGIH